MNRIAVYTLLACIVLFLSCGTEPLTDPHDPGNNEPWDGGTFPLAGGAVEVDVPAGAHATAITVTATPVSSPLASTRLVEGSVYDLGPDGTQFSLPVTLTLSYEGLSMPQGVIATELRIHKVVDNAWQEIPGSVVDTTAMTVSAQLTSLSQYGILAESVASLIVEPSDTLVMENHDVQLTARLFDVDGSELGPRVVEWSSNNRSVATVDSLGLVRGVSEGSTTIWAEVDGVSDHANVAVERIPVETVVVEPATASITVGTTAQLAATLLDSSNDTLFGRTVTWSTNDAAIADVDSTGHVWGVSEGSATISANAEGTIGTSIISVAEGTTWTPIGPSETFQAGIEDLTFDPFSPTTMYAGLFGGGVYRSDDSGETWFASNTGLPARRYVMRIVSDPSSSTNLYLGTSGDGLFRSTDAGVSWEPINIGIALTGQAEWPYWTVFSLAIDPTNPSTLYAGLGGGGLYKTENGGDSWTAMSGISADGWIYALAIDPQDPTVVYAGGFECGGLGLMKSVDSGANWAPVGRGLPGVTLWAIAVDPVNTANVYVAAHMTGVFKSTNAAADFSPINNGILAVDDALMSIAVDPVTPTTLYLAGNSATDVLVYRSTNGGQFWLEVSTGLPEIPTSGALRIDPIDHRKVYLGHLTRSGGIFVRSFP